MILLLTLCTVGCGTYSPSVSEEMDRATEGAEFVETETTNNTTEPTKSESSEPVETKPTETESTPATEQTEPTEPAHVHNYTSTSVPPTCLEDGYTKHVCACGNSYTDSATAATGHSWGAWTVTKQATTTSTGEHKRTCSVCGQNETVAIPVVEEVLELTDPATAYEDEVAQAIFKYINQFRAEEGSTQLTWLPGMSKVAQYRSRQLVTNMAHDTDDIREALAFYQYGEYVDWAELGCPELVDQNYYRASTQEAIGYAVNLKGTPDEIGYQLACAYRESEGHWRYLSSSDYSYCGIGVTYVDGLLYDCVMVGRINYG